MEEGKYFRDECVHGIIDIKVRNCRNGRFIVDFSFTNALQHDIHSKKDIYLQT